MKLRLNTPQWLMCWLQAGVLGSCLLLAACGGRVELMGSIAVEEASELLAALF